MFRIIGCVDRMAGSSNKRDFLAEYDAEACERAHRSSVVIGAARKRTKTRDAEAAAIEEFNQLLNRTLGEEQGFFLHALDVHVGEAGIKYAKEKATDPRAVLSDLTMIVSTYHLVGYFVQSPVYKAAQPDDTYPEAYLFYFGEAGEQGWYISTKWFYTLAQKKQACSAGLIKACCPGVGQIDLLEVKEKQNVYMPYWKKKPFPELWIQSTIDHKTEVVDALQDALESKDAIINDALQEVSEGHQQKDKSKNSKGTGKGPKPRHPAGVANGWMERAAILIQLLKDEEFEKAKEKAEYFEASFPSMQHALDRIQRSS